MSRGKPLSGHQAPVRGATDTWLTPPDLIRALGTFDLDPCTPPTMPWETAKMRYTEADDGLVQPWEGRVFLNPPFYGIEDWLRKMVEHGNGIALAAARTETRWWFKYIWGSADAILFMKGRPYFHHEDGSRGRSNSGAPIALAAYDNINVLALENSEIPGALVYRHGLEIHGK